MTELDKWDRRFLKIAYEVSSWSKDPGTKVGAVLVKDRRIISSGYNGFPQGIEDLPSRYDDRETKLNLTVHAEVNAILNAAKNGAVTAGSTLYVTFPPCISCSTAVIQAGISRIVRPHLSTAPDRWLDSFSKGGRLLVEAGIEVETFTKLNYD